MKIIRYFLLAIIYTGSLISAPSYSEQAIVRRVAIDIGSGTTKIGVADVDSTTNKIINIQHLTWVPVKLQQDAIQNDNSLSPKIENELIAAIRAMKLAADAFRPTQWKAVATSVFRTTKNGTEVLERVAKKTGLRITLLSQEEEGVLGLKTAVAVSGRPADEIIAFDSGAGSFQISSLVDGEISMYGMEYPIQDVTEALASYRGNSSGNIYGPEPILFEEALLLIDVIREHLPPCADWLLNSPKQITGLSGQMTVAQRIDKTTYTKEDVLGAIQSYCNIVGDQRILLKMMITYAIMDHCGMKEVTAYGSNGGIEGILTTPSFWE